MQNIKISAVLAAFLAVGSSCVAAENVRLETIEIKNSTGESISDSGISEHFLQKDALFGPLMDKKVKDIPLQINTVSNELVQNLQATGLENVWRVIPSATVGYMGSGSVTRPATRGMLGGVIGNNYWDGFMVTATTAVPMMIFDKLEVQNGLSGSLYGSQHPSGIFNYTRKRPVDSQTIVRVDWSEKANFGTMLDTSDRFEKVGYRGIFYFNDGEGFVKDSVKRSKLANLALDFYLTDDLTLETNFTYYNYIRYGYGARLMSPQTNGLAKFNVPGAIANDKKGIAQTWAGMDLESYNASAKLKYNINSDWYVEGGYQHHISDRLTIEQDNTIAGKNGELVSSVGKRNNKSNRFILQSWFVKAMGHETTGSIEHDLGISTYGYIYDSKTPLSSATADTWNQNINNMQSRPKPANFTNNTSLARALKFKTYNFTLADDVKINDKFSFLGALTYTWVTQDSFTSTNPRTMVGRYKDNALTYLAGLTYRPVENTSIYFSYSNSIQVDSLVTADNNTKTLVYAPPAKTKQYELGIKSSLNAIDVSAALFQIERPLYYKIGSGTNQRYNKQGKQVNRGLEATAGGKLGKYVSVYGGFMLLDPKLKNTKNGYADNKVVVGAPKFQTNLLFDFAVPNTNKLSFMTNLHYTGKRYVDDRNTQSVDGYFTTDVGVRYATKAWFGKEATLRFNVNNLFDKKYYVSVMGGNDGDGARGADLYMGDSRNFMASFEVKF
ncbi:TonB-dependent receptor [Campylobacter curvus]|uniref:TonB-dependent receptor n=1 Tax=Campylobacter curvus TaxID=200 RepID=UPI00037F6E3F|nr:TonB-dependent receptor [Campylobacter curvus]QKF60993.1 TonB-dependent receptor [Campylobacter curvus]UEB49311.1 TonB-dependent receptor [Campylobacter curvus]